MLAMMDTLMGGRAAEEIVFGADKITSGIKLNMWSAMVIYDDWYQTFELTFYE